MKTIGLTGGIGSGKSTVAAQFSAKGALVIDADAIAREVVAPGTPALAEIVDAFGPGVLSADGSLDRASLARLVFNDQGALAVLNAIVHPRVAEESQRLISAAPDDAVVVYDVPLLVENALQDGFDVVVVVEAPADVRLNRLVARGVPRADAEARMAAQATDAARREVADYVLENSGTPDQLRAAVDRVWQEVSA